MHIVQIDTKPGIRLCTRYLVVQHGEIFQSRFAVIVPNGILLTTNTVEVPTALAALVDHDHDRVERRT